ncbi:thioesterase II family protein [Micromonospora andamanensis]|uniref:Pyochelin biosynthetic protein PchC n=1 Tax=Micromonospora andamanensis TaxID=1287068 RepID=A0ABQ4HTE0_9ACTN|nr:alpha/beta fold hydrolase [Micromonospora andamanensis]GIJ08922.1 pyochelin biosynthetic protein PchC [Micromonospora andamanensis]
MADDLDRWLRCFHTRPAARVRLVCFPHASGNALFYRDWGALLPGGVETWAVQYPGRLDRLSEPCVTDMAELADRVTEALLPFTRTGGVALFGHSMGAAVAYEVTRRLEHRLGIAVRHLFVSAHPSPALHRIGNLHLDSDDALWDELRRQDATSAETLAHPQLRALIMPALRSDYRLIETWQPALAPPLSCPVTALGGRDDPDVAPAELTDWARFTTGPYRRLVRPGGHFYLVEDLDAVVAALGHGLGDNC